MQRFVVLTIAAVLIIGFQNCSNVQFEGVQAGKLGVCENVSCELTPLTGKPAVTTILIALGDEANNELVVKGASSQLIAETIVRYSSPVSNPKILIVRDVNAGGESAEDTVYIQELLKRYDTNDNVKFMQEPAGGLKASDVEGYDLVWLNNPGNPMGSVETRDVLLNFAGGVVLQGDDLAWGRNFDNSALTGLKYIDNGTSISCGGQTYGMDNNAGSQFKVTLDASKITGSASDALTFNYGNDIDNTSVLRDDLEVLAYAKGDIASCTEQRPAIVRYTK